MYAVCYSQNDIDMKFLRFSGYLQSLRRPTQTSHKNQATINHIQLKRKLPKRTTTKKNSGFVKSYEMGTKFFGGTNDFPNIQEAFKHILCLALYVLQLIENGKRRHTSTSVCTHCL